MLDGNEVARRSIIAHCPTSKAYGNILCSRITIEHRSCCRWFCTFRTFGHGHAAWVWWGSRGDPLRTIFQLNKSIKPNSIVFPSGRAENPTRISWCSATHSNRLLFHSWNGFIGLDIPFLLVLLHFFLFSPMCMRRVCPFVLHNAYECIAFAPQPTNQRCNCDAWRCSTHMGRTQVNGITFLYFFQRPICKGHIAHHHPCRFTKNNKFPFLWFNGEMSGFTLITRIRVVCRMQPTTTTVYPIPYRLFCFVLFSCECNWNPCATRAIRPSLVVGSAECWICYARSELCWIVSRLLGYDCFWIFFASNSSANHSFILWRQWTQTNSSFEVASGFR